MTPFLACVRVQLEMEKAFSQSDKRRERMKKQRNHYTPEEKVAILRRHLLAKEPKWKLCDEVGL
jgi:hypothetical protein